MTQRYIGGLIYNPPGGYSGYFNGSSSYLSAPDNSAWYFTGDFTVECWAYWNNTSSSEANVLAQHRPASAANQAINFYSDTTTLYFVYSSSNVSTTIAAGQWYHLAMSCTSGTASCYVNGVRINTFSMPSRIDSADPFTIGARTGSGGSGATGYFPGYISNVRVINGTGIYSGSSITVPTGALQNITNTKLLTCQSATFIDNSSSPFTITNNSATVSTQNPFPLTTLPNPAQGGAGNGIFSMSQYQSLKQQNLWPTVDPYFDYTTLLLHGNGTNGGQNNTFLDSGTANGGVGFSITRNGDTTQGTFSPFSVGAGYWSNYFDGSGDYLTIADNAALQLGSGDFCIEWWMFPVGTNSGPIMWGEGSGGGGNYFNIHYNISGSGTIRVFIDLLSASYVMESSVLSTTAWTHVAVTRSGSTFRLFINGTQSATYTNAGSVNSGPLTIGSGFSGYISNSRTVKGSAVYTSAFTPSTTPLTAITNTSLLTCQSNRFVDNSSNAFTITVTGDTSVQAFSPFAPTAAYSASTVGGSGYFDGSGDVLSIADAAALELGSSDFCVEGWYYPLSFSANLVLVGKRANTTSTGAFIIYANSGSGALTFYASTNGSTYFWSGATVGTMVLNQWNHFAVYRSGNNWYGSINGVVSSMGTSSNSIYNDAESWRIGGDSNGNYANGYIASTRIVIGSAVYGASNFTPPTAPLTNITNTSLLLNFTNAAIIDNTAKNDLVTVGNAQISTTQSKFGGASMYFDGTGDWLTSPATVNTSFGTGNFTVECWIYSTVNQNNNLIVSNRVTAVDTAWSLEFYNNGTGNNILNWHSGTTIIMYANTAANTNTWNHVAVVRSGTTTKIYLNGTEVASATDSRNYSYVGPVQVGYEALAGTSGIGYYNGYIDDLRITKGIARYTSNFTPQTSQWQDQ